MIAIELSNRMVVSIVEGKLNSENRNPLLKTGTLNRFQSFPHAIRNSIPIVTSMNYKKTSENNLCCIFD